MNETSKVTGMPMWKKFWLLFSAIWVFVCVLSVVTILAVGDATEHPNAITPGLMAVFGPMFAYGVAWSVAWWRRRAGRED